MLFLLADAQNKIGYKFKDSLLLRQCFTHASYANEHKGEKDNERLEFLGDSVLGLIITEYLYKNKREDEGGMTADKQKIVSTKPLAEATRRLQIENYLLVGGDDNRTITDKVCENLFESVIVGIYLDGGYDEAKKFVLTNLIPAFEKTEKAIAIDYKSELNELVQKRKLGVIKYKVLDKLGNEHQPVFKVSVSLNGEELAVGKGGSKKSAEQSGAKTAIQKLKKRK